MQLPNRNVLRLKKKFKFYSNYLKSAELFDMRAEKVLDVHGKYFAKDSEGNQLGALPWGLFELGGSAV